MPSKPIPKNLKGTKTGRKLSAKGLKKKYEPQVRDILKRRDNNRCQIAGRYHTCGGPLVADHRPVNRGHNLTFFDHRNLTIVCNTANGLAQTDEYVREAICQVVKKREGVETFYKLRDIAKGHKTKRWREEEVIQIVEKLNQMFPHKGVSNG